MPEHEGRSPKFFLTSKEKGKGRTDGTEIKETNRTTQRTTSLWGKEKAGSCGPVITVTAEWSVHGFAGTEEEQCGGNSHPQRLTPNNDARIFTQVHKVLQKVTHSRAPARAPTDAPRAPNPGAPRRRRRRAATTPQHMPPTTHGTHSNPHSNHNDKSPTKGFCPHMATCHSMSHIHESPLTLPLVNTPLFTRARPTT